MWPCGNFDEAFEELPDNWPKSHWAWYNAESRAAVGDMPGQTMTRICMGCVVCSNPACDFRLRPQVRKKGRGIFKQLERKCENPICNSPLEWEKCDARAYWTTVENSDGGRLGRWKHQG